MLIAYRYGEENLIIKINNSRVGYSYEDGVTLTLVEN